MVITLIGMQWGDEGKGKFIDYLAKDVDWVIRYAGGANAGHTIVHDGKKYAFHLLPTGILNPKVKVLLGPAMVIEPEQMIHELKVLEEHAIAWKGRVFISDRAHLVLPSYKEEDVRYEEERKNPIGTTKKGIGIAYAKRALRTGIRIADIDDLDSSEVKNQEDINYINTHKAFLKEYSINHFECVNNIQEDEKVLFEGAQGTMLDTDIGTYPYVTSGPTALNGVYTCGVPAGGMDEVIGVIKAYTSRVGAGPFPTEFREDEKGLCEYIQKVGNEVGTTTGRLRRCGHLDLPALNFASTISGITSLAITHVDVLDELEEISICIGYSLNGKEYNYLPTSLKDQENLTPVFETISGWKTDTTQIKTWRELPDQMKKYFEIIETHVRVPIKIVSIGPDRNQTIRRDNYLKGWLNM